MRNIKMCSIKMCNIKLRNIKISVLLMFGLLISVSSVFGQIVYDQPTSGGGRMIYNHWSLEDSSGTATLNQFVIPIFGFIPLEDNSEIRFSVSSISSKLEQSGTDYKLSGLGDIRIQFNKSLSDDQFLLSLGLNLPIGKKELDKHDEWPVMEYLAKDYLNLPVRRYGEGLGVNLLAGTATQVGVMQLGGSVSYNYNGPYTAYETDGGYETFWDSDDYNPGNMFSVSAGLDGPYKNLNLSGRLSFSTYGTDKFDDKKIFKAGDQLTIQLGVTGDNESFGFRSNINYIIRGRSTRYDTTEVINSQLKIYGNEFGWNSSVSLAPAENYYVVPSIELRFIGANEEDLGKAHLIGLGSEFGKRFSDDLDINIGFKYYTGSADGGEIDLKGFQLSLGLAAVFR